MIYTFYSYKGGTGRSMALANIAEIFYQAGHKVLVVDWDLEAPGLERFFPDTDKSEHISDHDGLINMLLSYKEKMAKKTDNDENPMENENIEKYLIDIYPNSTKGKLFLLTAGQRSNSNFSSYVQSVLTFDWQDFYKNWAGAYYFEWLREQFESVADIILIDSRTGVTEMSGVCTYQLADTIVMFCTTNQQNIDGSYEMILNFTSSELLEFRPDRPLNVLIVPARVEDRSEVTGLNTFRSQFINKFDMFLSKLPVADLLKSFWDLNIPYIPYCAFYETVAVRNKGEAYLQDIIKAYISLAGIMNKLRGVKQEILQLPKIYKAEQDLSNYQMNYMENHLIIGLGGTGGKIIRAFRKAFFREFRKDKLDKTSIEYLYIDSSSEMMFFDDPSWKILGTSVQLGSHQQLHIQGLDLTTIFGNINRYPGIKRWIGNKDQWEDILNSIIGDVLGGQKRRLGRFLFASKISGFRQQLQNLVGELHKSGSIPVTFHICCGLAGGTGSGSIIDVISQIRDIYPDFRDYRIVIYALLPDTHPKPNWDTGNYHANGYAALMELNSLNCGRWEPHDVSGNKERLKLQNPFNGCYLFANDNENGLTVDVDKDIPNIVADFLYQKIISVHNISWDSLKKMENAENGDVTPEYAPGTKKGERSKRFLTFGIKRLVIPEDEIRDYMTYSFARQASLQILYNNWMDSVGFFDEPRNIPFHEFVSQKETREKWLISDEHLCLSVGILQDEIDNKKWKSINNEWLSVIPHFKTDAREQDGKIWIDQLFKLCEKRFDQNFRGYGVRRFYEMKTGESKYHVKEIRKRIESDIFTEWANGVKSVHELVRLLDALIADIEKRLANMDDKIVKAKEGSPKQVVINC